MVFNESGFELLDDTSDVEYKKQLDLIKPLDELIQKYQPDLAKEDIYFIKEFILWGLVSYDKLSKDRIVDGYQFSDMIGNYINKM